MLCEGVVHPSTHPFFGHMRRRLCTRLEELGWKIRSLVPPSDIPDEMAGERPKYYSEYTPELVAKACDADSNLAGIILSGLPDTYTDEIMKLGRPYVTLSLGWNHPSITYDWEKELFRAISVAIEAGIRSLWVVSAIPLEKVNALARAAAVLANDKGPFPAVTHIIPSQQSRTYSATTLSAYSGVRERLASGLPEAIVIHGDFETQGVLDALAENGDAVKRPPLIVALVNKASQIHSRFSYTALVADGYALGEAAADLLQEQITNPQHTPLYVRMSCMVRGEPGGLPGPAMAMSKSSMIEGKQAKNQEATR